MLCIWFQPVISAGDQFLNLVQFNYKAKDMKKNHVIKALLFGMLSIIIANGHAYAQSWQVDKVHSTVRFNVSHLVISEVEGSFKVYEGKIESKKPDFTDAVINFKVDVNSIHTDNGMRDEHLKSPEFFNAKEYPGMSFKSTSFRKKSGNKYELTGDLTIRDVTKKVVFDVTYGGTIKDGYGNIKSGFKAVTSIDRFAYGLKWNALNEPAGATVGKDVGITLNLEFAQSK